jgi:hypothetical protein
MEIEPLSFANLDNMLSISLIITAQITIIVMALWIWWTNQ